MTLERFILFILFNVCLGVSYGQSFINKTIQFDGETREYEVYVPAIYDGTLPVPLIFNFHGGGGDINSQISISDMSPMADTANFIVVYPQALPDPNSNGSTSWLHKSPTDLDDVVFVDALIDTLAEDYQIDMNRIYACGYSLGGEFSYELGCRLNNRIAAIGVVARTMYIETYENCAPIHPTGILTILGTSDPISDYNGVFWNGVQYYLSAEEVHDYWAEYNNCEAMPNVAALPDINSSDGSTVERYSWANSEGCVYVEHLKVTGGGHDWPGSFGNMDMNATEEIWNFVSRYDQNGIIECTTTSIEKVDDSKVRFQAYPNPLTNQLIIETDITEICPFSLSTIHGEIVLEGNVNFGSNLIDISLLTPGIYIFKIKDQSIKLIKSR